MTVTPAEPLLTPDQEDAVIAAVSEGARTLKRACAAEGMPRPWQVLAHARAVPTFGARLDAATEVEADRVHDEMIGLERKVAKGAIEPAAANAALSSKRWRLERLDRRRWGAKVEVENKGELTLTVTTRRFTPTNEEPSQ